MRSPSWVVRGVGALLLALHALAASDLFTLVRVAKKAEGLP